MAVRKIDVARESRNEILALRARRSNTMKVILGLIAALAVLALASFPAVAAHHQITVEDVEQFKVGVSTYADVIAKLGKPSSVSIVSNGTRIVAYVGVKTHVKAATFVPIVGLFAGGATGDTSVASFTFGPDGLLQASSATDSAVDCSGGILSAGCQGGAVAVPPAAISPPTTAPTQAPAPTSPPPPAAQTQAAPPSSPG